jgi:hypothetical protein
MTGEYYIADEFYQYRTAPQPDHIMIAIMCRCLEFPRPKENRKGDYLGLEVNISCLSENFDTFEIFSNTNSSSI